MPCTIQESPRPGIWSATYEGHVALRDRLEAFSDGRKLLEGKPASGLLIDFRRAHLETSREEAYDLARERMSPESGFGLRRALLFDSVGEEAEFEAVVAQNRGLEVRAFSDEEKAMAWLVGQEMD